MKRAALIYARVSTDDQAEHGYSLATQVEACRRYAAEHGLVVRGEPIIDDYTGAKLARPGLDRLRSALERGEASAVVVYSTDRLSRSLAHSLLLRDEWHRAGVELHLVNRGRLGTSAEDALAANIESVFAEYERAKIAERSRRGLRAKAAAGRWVGTGHPPFGFRRKGRGREAELQVDKREAAAVRRIYRLYIGQGEEPQLASTRAIAELLTRERVPTGSRGRRVGRGWYPAMVGRVLTSRNYLGEFCYAGQVVRLPGLAIVDEATFAAAQRVREQNRRRRRSRRENLLSGHLRCTCGHSMGGNIGGAGRAYYRCTGRANYGYLARCDEPGSIRQQAVDAAVWAWVDSLFRDPALLERGLEVAADEERAERASRSGRAGELAGELAAAERRYHRLLAVLDDDDEPPAGLASELRAAAERLEVLAAERAGLERAARQAAASAESRRSALQGLLADVLAWLDEPDFATQREILAALGLKVQLRRDDCGRWLDVTCSPELGLAAGGLEERVSAARAPLSTITPYTPAVIFSASLPLDSPAGQPSGQLAESLFAQAPAARATAKHGRRA